MLLKVFLFCILILSFKAEEEIKSELIKKVVSNIVKTLPEIKNDLSQEKISDKISEKVNQIVQSGFLTFKQTADIQYFTAVTDQNLDGFLRYAKNLVNLPSEYEEYFVENLSMILYSDYNEIVIYKVLFNVNSGGDCKYICVMGQRRENGETDWLIGDVKAFFNLANDVLIMEKVASEFYGTYEKHESKVLYKPKSVSDDDLNVLFKYFEVVVFEKFAEVLKLSPFLMNFLQE